LPAPQQPPAPQPPPPAPALLLLDELPVPQGWGRQPLLNWLKAALQLGEACPQYPWGTLRTLTFKGGSDLFTLQRCFCNGEQSSAFDQRELLAVFAQGGAAIGPAFDNALATHARQYYLACRPPKQTSSLPANWAQQSSLALNYPDSQRQREAYTLASQHIAHALGRMHEGLHAATLPPHLSLWFGECLASLTTASLLYESPAAFPPAPPTPPTPQPLPPPPPPSAPQTAPARQYASQAPQSSHSLLKRPLLADSDSQTQQQPPQPQPGLGGGWGGAGCILGASQEEDFFFDIPSAQ
jgi:hypothetical protein